MNHHTAYKIHLLHLLVFFQTSLIFFISLENSCCSLFHNKPPYCQYNTFVTLVALFRTFSEIVFTIVAVGFTMNHHSAYKIHLLHLLRFFQTSLIFFYNWTNLLAVCFTMNHHTAYKIPLLHLLRFLFILL